VTRFVLRVRDAWEDLFCVGRANACFAYRSFVSIFDRAKNTLLELQTRVFVDQERLLGEASSGMGSMTVQRALFGTRAFVLCVIGCSSSPLTTSVEPDSGATACSIPSAVGTLNHVVGQCGVYGTACICEGDAGPQLFVPVLVRGCAAGGSACSALCSTTEYAVACGAGGPTESLPPSCRKIFYDQGGNATWCCSCE
jgi:hypothetical protein